MFRATYDQVLAYALRRTSRGDAEDVVAETYATAWRRFDDVPEDALPWLYGVARRTLANWRRTLRRRNELYSRIAGELHSSSIAESDPSDTLEEAAMMRAALRKLRPKEREALMLVAWEGLDNERSAIAMGVSTTTFAVRLHRARRRYEERIAEADAGLSDRQEREE